MKEQQKSGMAPALLLAGLCSIPVCVLVTQGTEAEGISAGLPLGLSGC